MLIVEASALDNPFCKPVTLLELNFAVSVMGFAPGELKVNGSNAVRVISGATQTNDRLTTSLTLYPSDNVPQKIIVTLDTHEARSGSSAQVRMNYRVVWKVDNGDTYADALFDMFPVVGGVLTY